MFLKRGEQISLFLTINKYLYIQLTMEFKNLIVNHYKHYIALQNCEVENYDEDKLQQLKSKHELERFEINNLIKDNENAYCKRNYI